MRKLNRLIAFGVLALLFGACSQESPTTLESSSDVDAFHQGPPGSVLTIRAVHGEGDEHYAFELSSHEIPSGWTTLELVNETRATHFAFLRKASPEFLAGMREDFGEVSAEAFLEAGSIPFQEEWNPYFRGEILFPTFLANLGARTPTWFPEHRPVGGPGLTSGDVTARTTQNLEPGTYFVECYVLGEDGRFHTLGMAEKLVVTDESSGGREPRPSLEVTLSDLGIEVENAPGRSEIRPGMHTVAVTFEENTTPSGHDLHLIRLEPTTSVAEVNAWMDWPDVGPDGRYNTDAFGPALTSYHDQPGPQTWLGGVQDIRPPLPETAYVHARLRPGEYAWVAEIPNPRARGFLETFTVPGHGVPGR